LDHWVTPYLHKFKMAAMQTYFCLYLRIWDS